MGGKQKTNLEGMACIDVCKRGRERKSKECVRPSYDTFGVVGERDVTLQPHKTALQAYQTVGQLWHLKPCWDPQSAETILAFSSEDNTPDSPPPCHR